MKSVTSKAETPETQMLRVWVELQASFVAGDIGKYRSLQHTLERLTAESVNRLQQPGYNFASDNKNIINQ